MVDADFVCSVTREGLKVDALVGETVQGALDDAGLGAEVIEVIHMGPPVTPLQGCVHASDAGERRRCRTCASERLSGPARGARRTPWTST